jgi:hypothetical protein
MTFTPVRRTIDEQRKAAPSVTPRTIRHDLNGGYLADAKRVGHNRALLTYSDGTQGFMLHLSVIAWRRPDGRVYVDHCGFKTSTTRVAILDAQEMFGVVDRRNYSIKSLPPGEWVN